MNTFYTSFVDELAKVAKATEKKKSEEKKKEVQRPLHFLTYADIRRFSEGKAKELGSEESKRRFVQRQMIARGF